MNTSSTQNQLIYTTVRIVAFDSESSSIGTGFFIQRDTENDPVIFLATNKHIVGNYEKAEIILEPYTKLLSN